MAYRTGEHLCYPYNQTKDYDQTRNQMRKFSKDAVVMADKCKKSLIAIKRIKIKTTLRRWSLGKQVTNAGEVVDKRELLRTARESIHWSTHC